MRRRGVTSADSVRGSARYGSGNQRQHGAQRGPAGGSENVRVREGITKQRLKRGARHGERRADDDGQENPRQADVVNDHVVVAGEFAGLAEQHVKKVEAEAVERNGNGAELQGDDHHDKEDDGENAATQNDALEGQRAHAGSSVNMALDCLRCEE